MTGTLTMRKEGKLVAYTFTACQCRKEGEREYPYVLEICCSPDQLDERGFIIDVDELDELLQEEMDSVPMRSCELMADHFARFVRRLLTGAQWVSFTLFGASGGMMTARVEG